MVQHLRLFGHVVGCSLTNPSFAPQGSYPGGASEGTSATTYVVPDDEPAPLGPGPPYAAASGNKPRSASATHPHNHTHATTHVSREKQSTLTEIELVLRVRPALVHRALAGLVERGGEGEESFLVALAAALELDLYAVGAGDVEPAVRRGLDREEDARAVEDPRLFGLEFEQGGVRDGERLEGFCGRVRDEDQLRSGARGCVARGEWWRGRESGTRG